MRLRFGDGTEAKFLSEAEFQQEKEGILQDGKRIANDKRMGMRKIFPILQRRPLTKRRSKWTANEVTF